MKNDKSIDVLNSLIVINNDRISGYETAIEETDDQDLKISFAKFVQTSNECKNELVKAVTSLGGTPEDLRQPARRHEARVGFPHRRDRQER